MIENPKVGQRVATRDMYGRMRAGAIAKVMRDEVLVGDGNWSVWRWKGELYDASALRTQAAELIAAADKLEQEETNA